MKDKICWVRQENVSKVWIHKGNEYSHRLINKKDQNCGFSFHITTYEPHFDTIVEELKNFIVEFLKVKIVTNEGIK